MKKYKNPYILFFLTEEEVIEGKSIKCEWWRKQSPISLYQFSYSPQIEKWDKGRVFGKHTHSFFFLSQRSEENKEEKIRTVILFYFLKNMFPIFYIKIQRLKMFVLTDDILRTVWKTLMNFQ